MNIPVDLLQEAVKISGAHTQTMAVVMGLQELIRKKKIERLMSLKASNHLGLTQKDLQSMRQR